MSPLIAFYRGLGTDGRGRTLADLWAFSDEEMEDIHDFIQWMFPLREPSQFNPDAPLLTPEDIAAFRSDPVLRQNLLRSFDRFLAFAGLERKERRVVERPAHSAGRELWSYPNHNWLRITRVLHSLCLLGMEEEARAFFEGLEQRYEGGASGITPETFGYWKRAMRTTQA